MKTFERRLAAVQALVGSAMPSDYASLLRCGVPAYPYPVGVPFRGELWDVVHFFELGRGNENQQLDSVCELVVDVLPQSAVPIASDHAGNFFCLFVAGTQSGQVVWWDHERELGEDHTEFVACSLGEFMRIVQPFPSGDPQLQLQADTAAPRDLS